MNPPLKIGILGAGAIARTFIKALASSQKITAAAVANHDPRRARAVADEIGVAPSHDNYEALLSDSTIEAIYNPLPNHLHKHWTLKAVDAGKHVLCEKPLVLSAGDAKDVFASAQRRGVRVVEAYPYRAQPFMRALDGMLSRREIG